MLNNLIAWQVIEANDDGLVPNAV